VKNSECGCFPPKALGLVRGNLQKKRTSTEMAQQDGLDMEALVAKIRELQLRNQELEQERMEAQRRQSMFCFILA
jgi:hypothetical protein